MPDDAYAFGLSWRWTQASHNVLPPEVMARIKPLARVTAPAGVMARSALDASLFDDIRVSSADVSTDEGTTWLRRLPVGLEDRVTVRWDKSTAVEMTWEVFTRYWDDFCYPSSDDVAVFPDSTAWLLLYDHEEVFEWGRRREA